MIESLAGWLVQRRVAWMVVALTGLVCLVSFPLALHVEQDDDVLAFLPRSNPDIEAFYEINERFGGTDVALVGLAPGDVFEPDFLRGLHAASRALRDTEGLDSVLTLTNVADFTKDPVAGGIVQSSLVEQIPENAEQREALRAKVMSRDHIVGTLVSERGDATVIYAFAAPGEAPADIALRVRAAIEEHLPDVPTYWGGAPFISTWIFETTQADMATLTPWAVISILVIMMVAFRDLLGTALGLFSTLIGIAVSRALMVAGDVSFNIVLSSMPIILFAIGSAYAIHMLSRYDAHAREVGETPEAVRLTLVSTGPTVFAAGMTTVAGLMSFLMMDIEPMRTFGLFTAIGIFTALVLSLTFVPAVMALFPRPVRSVTAGPLRPLMLGLVTQARTHRVPTLLVVGAVATVGLLLAGEVDTRMDLSAFYAEDTEPADAQAFLDEHFGGSQFLQVQLEADLEQPEVLRELGRVADHIRLVEHVSDVSDVEGVMAIINDAMSGARRVPDTSGQVSALYRFLSSDPSVSRLVTDERDAALLQVKIASNRSDDLDAVLDAVREIVATSALKRGVVSTEPDEVAPRNAARMADRMVALAHRYEVPAVGDLHAATEAFLTDRTWKPDPLRVARDLEAFLGSEESWVVLEGGQPHTLGLAIARLGANPDETALAAAMTTALSPPADADTERAPVADVESTVMDLAVVLEHVMPDLWRHAEAFAAAELARTTLLGDAQTPGLVRGLHALMEDVDVQGVLVPSEASDALTLTWRVSGMPVLYQGLSKSVTANQFKSLGSALVLVFLIMTLLFRSVATGLLATAPTALTLAMVYGGMGLLGVHLDIGTSMLASIIIGAGVDYAVHLMAAWEGDTPLEAALLATEETSHAIWTNAIMVAAGFFVLTLGDAKPLQNVGGLTSAAMLLAAVSTFVVIPLLATRSRYSRES